MCNMHSKRDDSVPVKGSWAQALTNRPSGEVSNRAPGVGNGVVDLQMATEAFRDAFSATAPSMEWPDYEAADQEWSIDPLLAEAQKSPANPISGMIKLSLFSSHVGAWVVAGTMNSRR